MSQIRKNVSQKVGFVSRKFNSPFLANIFWKIFKIKFWAPRSSKIRILRNLLRHAIRC